MSGLEMSGAPAALDQMIDHLVMGGRVALLGVPAQPFIFDLGKIVFRMITLRGIYGREMFETWHKMLAMLESGLDVRKVITRRMKADDYAEAFRLAAGGEKGKIVLEWSQASGRSLTETPFWRPRIAASGGVDSSPPSFGETAMRSAYLAVLPASCSPLPTSRRNARCCIARLLGWPHRMAARCCRAALGRARSPGYQRRRLRGDLRQGRCHLRLRRSSTLAVFTQQIPSQGEPTSDPRYDFTKVTGVDIRDQGKFEGQNAVLITLEGPPEMVQVDDWATSLVNSAARASLSSRDNHACRRVPGGGRRAAADLLGLALEWRGRANGASVLTDPCHALHPARLLRRPADRAICISAIISAPSSASSSCRRRHECIYCVVDMHAITVPRQEPDELRRSTREVDGRLHRRRHRSEGAHRLQPEPGVASTPSSPGSSTASPASAG